MRNKVNYILQSSQLMFAFNGSSFVPSPEPLSASQTSMSSTSTNAGTAYPLVPARPRPRRIYPPHDVQLSSSMPSPTPAQQLPSTSMNVGAACTTVPARPKPRRIRPLHSDQSSTIMPSPNPAAPPPSSTDDPSPRPLASLLSSLSESKS